MKNGVANGVDRRRNGFTPWFWSGRMAAKIEAAIVVCVFAVVIAIMALLFEMPGPLVVHLQDDQREAVKGANVRCTSPDGATSYAGATDVFGEAKWPGLAKGAWKCEVTPPPKYHAEVATGFATVVARHPAMWTTSVERPGRILVQVVRPQGAPRAPVAVRAVCGREERASPATGGARRAEQTREERASPATGGARRAEQTREERASPATGGARRAEQTIETWEARAGLLDGRATLFVPHGKECRVGLVFPELPGEGPSTQAKLDCDKQPCAGPLTAGVGEEASATLKPTLEQWMAVRPPIEPEKPTDH
jgi:hypothetical protein